MHMVLEEHYRCVQEQFMWEDCNVHYQCTIKSF